MNRVYRMSREEYQGLLKVASEQIPFGIMLWRRKDMQSFAMTGVRVLRQLKGLTRQFRAQASGFVQRGQKEGR